LYDSKEQKRRFDNQLWLQRWLCYYCEKSMAIPSNGDGQSNPDQATRDHLIAKSKGGRRIVASCMRCNNLKGSLGAERFTRIVRKLLENPRINKVWHSDITGLTSVLYRVVRVEIWKEKQREKPTIRRQRKINKEIRAMLRLMPKLKP
jgi:hypothetical protein